MWFFGKIDRLLDCSWLTLAGSKHVLSKLKKNNSNQNNLLNTGELLMFKVYNSNSLITDVLLGEWDILDQHSRLSAEEDSQHCLEICKRTV